VQYAVFVKGLLKADFGRSFYYRTPVLELYLERLPNSLLLAVVAMAFSLAIGIPSGILAAVRVNGGWDRAGKIFALLGLVDAVVLGRAPAHPLLLRLSRLAALLRLRHPVARADAGLRPRLVLRGAHMRLTRSSMLEVLGSEYIKLARLKGLPEAS